MSSVFLSSPLRARGSDMFLSTVSVRAALTGEVPGDEHGGQNGTLRTKKAKTEVKGGKGCSLDVSRSDTISVESLREAAVLPFSVVF